MYYLKNYGLEYEFDGYTRLYRWTADFGRSGILDGLFFDDCRLIETLKGNDVYFGEVLGKHSEITYELRTEDFECIELDFDTLKMLYETLGQTASGFNPIRVFLEHDAEHGNTYQYLMDIGMFLKHDEVE
jgi:hypothetical protein